MGIKGLSKLISDNAPDALKENKFESYFNRKIAIDASMSIYQFLIAVRQGDQGQLTNEAGEVTSHLTGMFYRTIRMVENGIKPVFVFDGKPPQMKDGTLAHRKARVAEAQDKLVTAQRDGNSEEIERQSKRLVRATKEQNEDCKKLLRLMGIPVVEAPCEAEAMCAALCKAGKVYGCGTEDMDCLTFGTPILIRHLTFSEARKMPVLEVNLEAALKGLELNMEQFIDLCMLCGCDYMDSITGIGPVTALKKIKEHGNIEGVIKSLDTEKHPLPEPFPIEQVRELFRHPEIIDPEECDIKWGTPDLEGLIQFMVNEKGFQEQRIRNGVERLNKSKSKSAQGRLETFFGNPTIIKSDKRKEPDKKGKGPASKKQKGAKSGGKGKAR